MSTLREHHGEIASTQSRAIELARAGAPEGTRVVATTQTAGYGRLGHRWESPPGGLYLSVLLRPPRTSDALLPLAVGAHVADALGQMWGIRPRLKWPNDLLVARESSPARKLAGVLLDAVALAGPEAKVVAGIGINVRIPPGGLPSGLSRPAVALEELVTPCPTVREVEEVVVSAALDASRSLAEPSGAGREVERCQQLLFGVGARAWVDGAPAGRIRRIASDGALVVEQNGEPMTIRAGDLRVEDP